jgi:hypothetical protein
MRPVALTIDPQVTVNSTRPAARLRGMRNAGSAEIKANAAEIPISAMSHAGDRCRLLENITIGNAAALLMIATG